MGNTVVIRLAAWQLQRAKALIQAHLDEPLSIAWLARECALSRCHFSCAFRGSTGMSPHEWLTLARINRARRLLLDGYSVATVAQACGFNDQAHFSRVFARCEGLAPSRWRNAQQPGPEVLTCPAG
jgi:AraC family transcriptional regulator